MSSTGASEQVGGSSTATFTPSGTVGDTTLSENQMPRHRHTVPHGKGSCTSATQTFCYGSTESWVTYGSGYVDGKTPYRLVGGTEWAGNSQPHTHSFTGTSQTINTVPPYITVYMYKRTN